MHIHIYSIYTQSYPTLSLFNLCQFWFYATSWVIFVWWTPLCLTLSLSNVAYARWLGPRLGVDYHHIAVYMPYNSHVYHTVTTAAYRRWSACSKVVWRFIYLWWVLAYDWSPRQRLGLDQHHSVIYTTPYIPYTYMYHVSLYTHHVIMRVILFFVLFTQFVRCLLSYIVVRKAQCTLPLPSMHANKSHQGD